MPKPVCVPCQRFFRMRKAGFYFTEGMPGGTGVAPGTAEPEKWKSYKLWASDRWVCEGCGTEILCGFGSRPIRVQHEADFEKTREMLNATQFQVNDC